MRLAVAAAVMLLPSIAIAQKKPPVPAELMRMEAADLALDLKKYAGTRVTVTDCVLSGSRIEFSVCPIITKNGVGGLIKVNYSDDSRDVRKRATDDCTDFEPKRRCAAEVTGRVRASATGQVIGLEQAKVTWKFP